MGRVQALPSVAILAALAAVLGGDPARGQDATGPLAPPPSETHNVHRVTNSEPAAVPPPMPPAEIIKVFAEKEDQYLRARIRYGYKKTIKVTEFGSDGQPSGEYQVVLATTVDSDGKVYEKTLEKTQSTLQYLTLEPGQLSAAARIPAYPLTSAQLAKYELRYVGDEKVDEIDCFIFDAKPKFLERGQALFQGVVWVDKQYLEVVKTYGKWVTDLGPLHPPNLPFNIFETYRENVEGKYWFPNYSRSEEMYKLKDREINVRVTIKWTDFKPFPPTAIPPSSSAPPPPPPSAKP